MAGLASLLSRRTMNPRAAGAAAMRRTPQRFSRLYNRNVPRVYAEVPPGGKHGGQVVGYQGGGRTMNPRAAGAAAMLRNAPPPVSQMVRPPQIGGMGTIPPRGWQEGGPVGAAPEEVAMASEIFARATPEQQAQITGGTGTSRYRICDCANPLV